MEWDRPGKVWKGLGLESGGLPLWRLPLPLNGLDLGSVPEAVTGGGRQEKGTEEVEEETGSGKCCSKLFSWLRSRPDTLGVTINRETPPQRAGRGGQILAMDVPMFEGAGSTTKEEKISQHFAFPAHYSIEWQDYGWENATFTERDQKPQMWNSAYS